MAETRRWDTDTRGRGIGDGRAVVADVRRLAEALELPDWVAEDPDAHLLPHLARGCSAPESRFTLRGAVFGPERVYDIELGWSGPPGRWDELRAELFALVGRICEFSTHVRQRTVAGVPVFDVTTGTLDGDSEFARHGHVLRLRVSPA